MASSTRLLKGMARFFLFLALFTLVVPGWHAAAFATDYVEGEALVVLRNNIVGENGMAAGKLTRSLLESEAGSEYARSVAASAGGRVAATYAALSAGTGEILLHVRTETGESTEELISRLSANPNVLSATPNFYNKPFAIPNDPYYGMELSGYDYKGQWNMERSNLEAAWDVAQGSDAVYVAILDSGIQPDHPDLTANLDRVYSKSFYNTDAGGDERYYDEDGHGTYIAGVIGALGNDGRGVAGVNWRVKLISIRITDSSGHGTDSATVHALNYVYDLLLQGVRIPVLNFSRGGWSSFTPDRLKTSAQYLAFKTLSDSDKIVIVASAGNDGLEVGVAAPAGNVSGVTEGHYVYPGSFAELDNMIVVAASGYQNEAAVFVPTPGWYDGQYHTFGATNWSQTKVDIVAPGKYILTSCLASNTQSEQARRLGIASGYDFSSGTSIAAPHVAGAVALLSSTNSAMTASQLKRAILSATNASVRPTLASPYAFNTSGQRVSAYGLLDIGKVVNPPAPPFDPTPPETSNQPEPSDPGDGSGGGSSSDDSGGGCSAGGGIVLLLAIGCVFTWRRCTR